MKKYPIYFLVLYLLLNSCSTDSPKEISVPKVIPTIVNTFPEHYLGELNSLITDANLLHLYQNKKEFIWIDANEKITSEATKLIELIQHPEYFGLSKQYFQLDDLTKAIKNNNIVKIELLLTQSYAVFGQLISNGIIKNVKDFTKFTRRYVDTNWYNILNKGVKDNKKIKYLLSLQPVHSEYKRLQKGLEQYLKRVRISDSSILVKSYKKDSVKTYSQAVKALALHGFLPNDSISDSTQVIQAIKKFQYEHGLEVDGIVGRGTAKALSKSTLHYYHTAQIALEKWRWTLPFEPHHIFVNIATYKLKCYKNNQLKQERKIVVGTNTKRTPQLDSKLSYFIAYPYWYVPKSIIVEELVAKAQKDSTYLSRNGYEVFKNKKAINSKTIDWSQGSNYRIRQKGGKSNALGIVKFIFPNKYSVYFHDTPSKRLFKKGRRAYSHGCVRVNQPLKLVDYLLKNDSANAYTLDSVNYYIKNKQRKVISLHKKVPVHIRYFTAEADSNSQIIFYPDVYSLEKEIVLKP